MSSLTFGFDHDDDGADRRKLADGESNGEGTGITVITTTRRNDWWHNRDPTRLELSTTPAMADAVARQRYAGETRLVEIKQKA